MADAIKRMWVDRVPRFINRDRDGVDKWNDHERVVVTDLKEAHFVVYFVFGQNDQDVGRRVEFYMQGEHMATLTYGPPREGMIFRHKRRLIDTQYHV